MKYMLTFVRNPSKCYDNMLEHIYTTGIVGQSVVQSSDAVRIVLLASTDSGCSKVPNCWLKPRLLSKYKSSSSSGLSRRVNLELMFEGPGGKFGQNDIWSSSR